MKALLCAAAASLFSATAIGCAHREVNVSFAQQGGGHAEEIERSLDELPAPVRRAVRQHIGEAPVHEIEEIRRDGVPVFYEIEFEVDGRYRELRLHPDGAPVRGEHGPDDDDGPGDGPDDDDVHGDFAERELAWEELPGAVANTIEAHFRGEPVDEVEAVLYEGLTVLYEAEIERDGREREVMVFPDGTIAGIEEGDEPDGPSGEWEMSVDDLPPAVADAIDDHFGGEAADEIEMIRYEGITVLYEAEIERDGWEWEVAVFPTGVVAAQHRGEDD